MVRQAHISKSIADFPFLEIYKLDDYNNNTEPAVFFGMYRYEDWSIFSSHSGQKVIFWAGQDALNFKYSLEGVRSVTAHPKVYELIKSKGFNCELVKPSSFLNSISPQVMGENIYAYCPSLMPIYHGIEIIQELQNEYPIIIGDGSYSQTEWRNEVASQFYSQCYMGLCLSPFAGGGTSIIEMGLRGMPVVTNVFELPNCYGWKTIADIRGHIERFKKSVDAVSLARKVFAELDREFKWLNI